MKVCVVCSAVAFTCNFGAVTCESCKAFFRRNATRFDILQKCQHTCEINEQTRSKCRSCRLKKCFENGMDKNLILSEEEKERRKIKIGQNRVRKDIISLTKKCNLSTTPQGRKRHARNNVNHEGSVKHKTTFQDVFLMSVEKCFNIKQATPTGCHMSCSKKSSHHSEDYSPETMVNLLNPIYTEKVHTSMSLKHSNNMLHSENISDIDHHLETTIEDTQLREERDFHKGLNDLSISSDIHEEACQMGAAQSSIYVTIENNAKTDKYNNSPSSRKMKRPQCNIDTDDAYTIFTNKDNTIDLQTIPSELYVPTGIPMEEQELCDTYIFPNESPSCYANMSHVMHSVSDKRNVNSISPNTNDMTQILLSPPITSSVKDMGWTGYEKCETNCGISQIYRLDAATNHAKLSVKHHDKGKILDQELSSLNYDSPSAQGQIATDMSLPTVEHTKCLSFNEHPKHPTIPGGVSKSTTATTMENNEPPSRTILYPFVNSFPDETYTFEEFHDFIEKLFFTEALPSSNNLGGQCNSLIYSRGVPGHILAKMKPKFRDILSEIINAFAESFDKALPKTFIEPCNFLQLIPQLGALVNEVVMLAKNLQAFQEAAHADQINMIKGAFTEIMGLRLIGDFNEIHEVFEVRYLKSDGSVDVKKIKINAFLAVNEEWYNLMMAFYQFYREFTSITKKDPGIMMCLGAHALFKVRERYTYCNTEHMQHWSDLYIQTLDNYIEVAFPNGEVKLSDILKTSQVADRMSYLFQKSLYSTDISAFSPLLLELFYNI